MNALQQFTSTGHKFFLHQQAMENLRSGRGQPVVSHLMLTDTCQHTCAFCSVATREGNSLTMGQIKQYLDQLVPLGLKSVILSGGGNPILYKCRETKADFNDAVDLIHGMGLEIGLITNGMPMAEYEGSYKQDRDFKPIYVDDKSRRSWKTVRPETLDKCTWIRISMSGLDHKEREVFVPDIDPLKTTLGYSYVYHDIYEEPEEENHGKVSTIEDLRSDTYKQPGKTQLGKDRMPWLTEQIKGYVERTNPVYVRLLPNCLQPSLIPQRCEELQGMANAINPDVAFVQSKPPRAPERCFLGYVHPVLNSDFLVYPCDSVCLASAALNKGDHRFASPWAICKGDEIGEYFSKPVHSMVDSQRLCGGCVFAGSNDILAGVVDGGESPYPADNFTHPNFV